MYLDGKRGGMDIKFQLEKVQKVAPQGTEETEGKYQNGP